ncbi:hypothetical protein E2C01_014288 [Portunus trituberculatus]|uniref:Uncharacterized protein n=1 Tax=Portunus trituberculatus TaxID=210409 RepID=A0A5B7DJI4_PORTR|nr:hypothetical protein [Portunus trituberculatus]
MHHPPTYRLAGTHRLPIPSLLHPLPHSHVNNDNKEAEKKLTYPRLAEARRQKHLRFMGSCGEIGEIGQDTEMRV